PRPGGPTRCGQPHLPADRLIPERTLARAPPVPQSRRAVQYGRYVLPAHRDQRGVELPRRFESPPMLREQLAEDDVPHAETDAGEIHAGDFLDQVVVATAPADRPQLFRPVEQLEASARVVGEASADPLIG